MIAEGVGSQATPLIVKPRAIMKKEGFGSKGITDSANPNVLNQPICPCSVVLRGQTSQ
jgi:hypothetical protein